MLVKIYRNNDRSVVTPDKELECPHNQNENFQKVAAIAGALTMHWKLPTW
jgi:hypothetical protein